MSREILSFDYVDSKGKVTKRALVPFTKPTNNYFGIDIGQEDATYVLKYLDAKELLDKEYKKKLKELDIQFLQPSFRSFKADSMTNVVSTKL
jgi:hypothetical protein